MLRKILGVVVAAVAAFLLYVAMLPAEGRVSRSALIAAPAATLHAHVNDFSKWQAWSPWAKLDPNAKATFEGPASGPGAAFAWDGNDEVGAGKMTIVDSKPAESVKIKLDFTRPFASTSEATFTFKPEGDKTRVTWDMAGERPFIARVFCVLFQADKMVGEQFEQGLANLAAAVGAKAAG